MTDWTKVQDSEWTVRPISAGNAHDRLINRARLWAISKDFAEEFISEGIAQLAFGTKRGTAVAFLMQIIHHSFFPADDTELCDGKNAYNTANRVSIAEAILTAKSKKIRRQYGYYLMGHRLESKVYARGVSGHFVLSKTGTRQGDPWAGFAFSLNLMTMLTAMKEELMGKLKDLIITCIVDDIKVKGPVIQVARVHD